MAPPEKCARDDCTKPRWHWSPLCKEHFEAAFGPIVIAPRTVQGEEDAARRWISRSLAFWRRQAIDTRELDNTLFDVLVHAGTQVDGIRWDSLLADLPRDVIGSLEKCIQEYDKPRTFLPLPDDPAHLAKLIERTLAAQRELLAALKRRRRTLDREGP